MGKKILVAILVLACLLVFAGCQCEHDWKAATCEEPEFCPECEETQGEPLGHMWIDATCDAPKTCSTCGQTKGTKLDHQMDDSTCTIVCTLCGYVDPASEEHEWFGPNCVVPKVCLKCEFEESPPLGHEWVDATCLEAKHCSVCGEYEGDKGDHIWVAEGCVNNCEVCGAIDFSAAPHTLAADSDGITGVCTVCNKNVEYYKAEDKLYAVTEYGADETETVTYICSKTKGIAEPIHWFQNGQLAGFESRTLAKNTSCSAYYAKGKVYYFSGYSGADTATIKALMNAARKHISFSSVVYNKSNCTYGTLVGPGGWTADDRGEVFAAVDAYGKPFCIAHKFAGSWDVPDDPTQVWAVACKWMK